MKAYILWKYDPSVGYYSWHVLNDEDNSILSKGHKECFRAINWCDQRNISIVGLDDHGTRR